MQASLGTPIAEPFNSEGFQEAEGLSWGRYSLKQIPKTKIPVQVDYLEVQHRQGNGEIR